MTGSNPRILILTHCLPSDAADIPGNFLIDFSEHLTFLGAEVTILTQKMDRKNDIEFLSKCRAQIEYFNWNGGSERFSKLKMSSIKSLLSVFSLIINGRKAFRKSVKENNFDFILSCWVIPAGLWSLSISKKNNSAVWALGSDISVYSKKILFRQLLKLILARTGSIFTNSLNHKNEIRKLLKNDSELLYTSRILPSSSKKYEKTDKLKLLFIGRLEKIKGPDLLISALKISSIENFELNIIGDGSLRSILESDVAANGLADKIRFLGEKTASEISDHLTVSDYLVISSRSESMPVVFWEAMQTSTPVIATNVGDLEYYCSKFNVGRICNADEKSLSELLSFVMNLKPLRESLALNTRKVKDFSSINSSAEKIYNFAKSFSGRKNPKDVLTN
jgi:glycosyltransferase involved in cell wall biosynthesis